MSDTNAPDSPADEGSPGDFGEQPGVSTPTSIGHGRRSVEDNVPGSGQAPGQPPKDTDATGVTP